MAWFGVKRSLFLSPVYSPKRKTSNPNVIASSDRRDPLTSCDWTISGVPRKIVTANIPATITAVNVSAVSCHFSSETFLPLRIFFSVLIGVHLREGCKRFSVVCL